MLIALAFGDAKPSCKKGFEMDGILVSGGIGMNQVHQTLLAVRGSIRPAASPNLKTKSLFARLITTYYYYLCTILSIHCKATPAGRQPYYCIQRTQYQYPSNNIQRCR